MRDHLPARRSIRLQSYDYRQAGAYFVTVGTQDRICLFGDVVEDGSVRLTDSGTMIEAVWHQMPHHYQGVHLDACVVMPNHVHGIIVLLGQEDRHPRGEDGQPLGEGGHAFGESGQPRGDGEPRMGNPAR